MREHARTHARRVAGRVGRRRHHDRRRLVAAAGARAGRVLVVARSHRLRAAVLQVPVRVTRGGAVFSWSCVSFVVVVVVVVVVCLFVCL